MKELGSSSVCMFSSKSSSKLPNTTARAPIGGVPTCHEVAVKLIFSIFEVSYLGFSILCIFKTKSITRYDGMV